MSNSIPKTTSAIRRLLNFAITRAPQNGGSIDTLQSVRVSRSVVGHNPRAGLLTPGDESEKPVMPVAMWQALYNRGVDALKKQDGNAYRWLEEAARLNPTSFDVQEAFAGAALQSHQRLVRQGDDLMRLGKRDAARQAYAAAREL